jgi:hypothetical protein
MIRTPEDEVTTAGYLYAPFREGWTYQGATYAGHSDWSVDWNRRTPAGGWLEDTVTRCSLLPMAPCPRWTRATGW